MREGDGMVIGIDCNTGLVVGGKRPRIEIEEFGIWE